MKNNQVLDDLHLQRDKIPPPTTASKIGKWCAIISFILGTIFLLLGMYEPDTFVLYGFFFVIVAFFINLIVFINLLTMGSTPTEKLVNRKMALRMLINIPIAFVYLFLLISGMAISYNL